MNDAHAEVMTLEEAAELLRVSTKTLAKDAKAGKVPAAKIGREWRFSREQLMRRLNGNRAA